MAGAEGMMSRNITWESGEVSPQARQQLLGQKGLVVWLTGLSGSGKSTIATAVEKKLMEQGRFAVRLDGDNLRHGLNKDLGFSAEDRHENIRRIAEVAALFADTEAIVLVSAITPYRELREMAKGIIGEGRFVEVYVKADAEICRIRDPKGLYRKVAAGEIAQFTGLTDPYEVPATPALILDTYALDVESAVKNTLQYIIRRIRTDK